MAGKRHVLFVQGGGAGTHDDWDIRLVESLRRELGEGYEVVYPRMPDEDEPKYSSWKAALERELRALPAGSVVVGHSVGATILLGALAEGAKAGELAGILLVAAPFVGDGGWPSDELSFGSDLGERLPRGVPIHFFQGLKDDTVPLSHLEKYARAIPGAHVHRLRGRDHQLNDDMSEVARAIRAATR